MAKVTLKEGFARISNNLLNEIYCRKFNSNQLSALLAIMRFTYGYSRTTADLGNSFLSKATGIDVKGIKRVMKALIDAKVIRVFSEHTNTSARMIGINTNISEWTMEVRKGAMIEKENTSEEAEKTPENMDENTPEVGTIDPPGVGTIHPPGVGSFDPPGVGSFHPPGVGTIDPPNKESTKKNIKKDKENNITGVTSLSVYRFYEENGFGRLSPWVSQLVGEWLDEPEFEEAEELIIQALKIAIENGVMNWKYAEAILNNWKNNNIRTLEGAIADSKKREGLKDAKFGRSNGRVATTDQIEAAAQRRKRKFIKSV